MQGGKGRTSDFRSTEVRRSTKKYEEVQGSTEKYKEVRRSTRKYREVQGSTEKYREVRKKYHSFFSFFSQKQSKSVLLLGNVENSVPTNRTFFFCHWKQTFNVSQ